MAWKVVERRIGKAGPLKRRMARQRAWDKQYGEGNWEIGYVLNGGKIIGQKRWKPEKGEFIMTVATPVEPLSEQKIQQIAEEFFREGCVRVPIF